MISLVMNILVAMSVGTWEASAIPFFPWWAEGQPLFACLVLLLMHGRLRDAWRIALIAGFFEDAFRLTLVPGSGVRWVIVSICLHGILRQWLTNRSLYVAIALVLLARLMDLFLAWITTVFLMLTGYGSSHPFVFVSWSTLVWDTVVVGGTFCLMAHWHKRSQHAQLVSSHARFYDR